MIIFDGIEANAVIEEGDNKKQKYFNTFLMFSNISIISIFSFTRKYFKICKKLFFVLVCICFWSQFIILLVKRRFYIF